MIKIKTYEDGSYVVFHKGDYLKVRDIKRFTIVPSKLVEDAKFPALAIPIYEGLEDQRKLAEQHALELSMKYPEWSFSVSGFDTFEVLQILQENELKEK